jgi:dihydroorotate dehydrogenase electron transfer subunit
MYQENGRILEHQLLCDSMYRIRIASENIWREAKAGQFVFVKVSEGLDPFLRRPLSFHDVSEGSYELVYQVAGRGTAILSEMSCGDKIDCIGPLGNGFRVRGNKAIMVAGGVGIAPFLLLARMLVEREGKAVLLYGARTTSSLIETRAFRELGVTVKLATEDGSSGFRGTCVEMLESELISSSFDAIYACGPAEMLSSVARISSGKSLESCQLSVEERMACGVGACLGCSVKSAQKGYLTVCRDGPVFEAGEIAI